MPPVDRLIDAQAASRESLAAQLVASIVAAVRRFGGWYDPAQITTLAVQSAARSESSQRAVAALTDAYLARVATEIRGRPVAPVGAIRVAGLRAGVTHDAVYGRLADQYRYLTSKGAPDVLGQVETRAEILARTDLDLAMRAQSQKFMQARKVTGWRRVIHPELSKGGTCGLCIVASHRLYKADDLMPLHARCSCVPTPVYGADDPGSLINAADLKVIYEAAGSTGAADLKRTRYTVHDHAELGPQLVEAKAAWRTPAQVRAARTH